MGFCFSKRSLGSFIALLACLDVWLANAMHGGQALRLTASCVCLIACLLFCSATVQLVRLRLLLVAIVQRVLRYLLLGCVGWVLLWPHVDPFDHQRIIAFASRQRSERDVAVVRAIPGDTIIKKYFTFESTLKDCQRSIKIFV